MTDAERNHEIHQRWQRALRNYDIAAKQLAAAKAELDNAEAEMRLQARKGGG